MCSRRREILVVSAAHHGRSERIQPTVRPVTQDDWSRISHVATMLRAQELALTIDGGTRPDGPQPSLAPEQLEGTGIIGHGATRAEAAEDAWNRHAASDRQL